MGLSFHHYNASFFFFFFLACFLLSSQGWHYPEPYAPHQMVASPKFAVIFLTLWWHRLNLRHSPHSNKWHRTIAAYSSPLRWHRTTWYIHHPHGGIANLRHIHHSLNGIAPKAETLLTSLINLSRSVVASINPESLALARSNSSGCRPSHSSPKNFLAILQNFWSINT